MASKADQKNEARLKREAAQAAAAAAAKRNRNLQILGGVVFSALVVVVLVVLLSGGNEKKGPTDYAKNPKGSEPAGVTETKTLLTGLEQNGFALGDPKAPATIIEFLDVQCPFCRDHQLDEQPTIIKNLVRTGKAKLRLAPIALPQMGEDSQAGRIVAARLADKDLAWDFINLFYFNQGSEGTGYVTNDYLTGLVKKVPGADVKDAERASTPAIDKKLADIDKLQSDLGVTGTPSFAIGKTGDEPSTYELLTLRGNASTADQVADAVEKVSQKSGV